jgi:nucleotide-binding universal stress UspA family protein
MMSDSGVLIAHDFSERSERAARRAFQLAQDHGLPVHAAHIVDEAFPERKWLKDSDEDSEESIVERLKNAVSERLTRELSALKGESGVAIEPHAAFGYVAEQLQTLAERTGSRLLVIGAHGRHAVRDLLLGATAEQLLWYMHMPTLVVRGQGVTPYQQVVIAADFSEEAETAMAAVRSWFPKARVRIVHVIDSRAFERLRDAGMPNEALEEEWQQQDRTVTDYLQSMMERTGMTGDHVDVRIIHGHPVEEIENQVTEVNADLVVMGGHSRSRLTRWLPGRVSSRLVHQLPCDVMLARGD